MLSFRTPGSSSFHAPTPRARTGARGHSCPQGTRGVNVVPTVVGASKGRGPGRLWPAGDRSQLTRKETGREKTGTLPEGRS